MARRVKTWAKKEAGSLLNLSERSNLSTLQGVHGATNGHLSSYTFNLMVIFYMQQRSLQLVSRTRGGS